MDSWNEKEPMITVIVPVYQVHQYIRECVESLMYQTYKNLEIILVDDGSTDGSEKLCDEYAEMDGRIRTIHQKNRGLSGARNAGLDNVNGEYIAFIDSDDFVKNNYIEELYNLILKYNADIAICSYEKSETGIFKNCNEKDKEICMSSEELLKRWHGKYKKYETVVWNKLYHRNIFNRQSFTIRFPEGRKHEDVLISHLLIQNAKKIALTTGIFYLYRIREGSITAKVMQKENAEQNLGAQRERMEFFKKNKYWKSYYNLLKGYVLHRLWFVWNYFFYVNQ